MNLPILKSFSLPVRIAVYAGLLGATLMLASFVAGQCTGRSPKPAKPIPGYVDQGAPVPGPSSEAPTIDAGPGGSAIPDLDRAELAQIAAKYGLKLVPKQADANKGDLRADLPQKGEVRTDMAPAPSSQPAAQACAPGWPESWPSLIAERRFVHEPSGASADVAAFYMGPGERIDLRAAWNPWQEPEPKPASYFGNTARVEKGFLIGYVGIKAGEETTASPGIGGHLRYRGWRIGKATIDAGVLGLVTVDGDGAIMGGAGISWP